MASRADALSHRKATYKTPTRMMEPQEARRQAALAAQQRHRLQRQDATRTDIALFQSLSLADHDSGDEGAEIDRTEGVAKYVSTMRPSGGASGKPRKKRTSRWANFCMYAELLEMSTDDAMGASDTHGTDGVPLDLHENWIALAPLPAGKRCLAVSTQANGVGGVVSITSLKSRLNGHTLLKFPSSMPPNTILDCILDAHWQQNGLLHILDVVRWRGMEFDDCSADMRFWWRDVRLTEVGQLQPDCDPHAGFRYPVFLSPVPYTDRPSLSTFIETILPQCRTGRQIPIQVPAPAGASGDGMDVDTDGLQTIQVHLEPDGLLLYVRESYYESGTSPLCVWVPSKALDATTGAPNPLDMFESILRRRINS